MATTKNAVVISFDDEKIQALKMYLSEKKTSLDKQLSAYAEQLYGKIVPQNVRDYIDMTAKQQAEAKPKKSTVKATDQP